MKYKAVLFDLDGTLLPLDLDQFLNDYFRALSAKVAHKVAPDKFIPALLASTQLMLSNDGGDTNENRFMADFFQRLEHSPQDLRPIFDHFYQNEFRALGKDISPAPQAREAVEKVLASGARPVLATNPLFPLEAVKARLEWAGLRDFPFEHVTSYENSSFCKPNPGYYKEILEQLGLEGQDCLMVGNDTKEDLVAAALGLDTFLLEDYLIQRESPYPPTWRGGWADLLRVLDGQHE